MEIRSTLQPKACVRMACFGFCRVVPCRKTGKGQFPGHQLISTSMGASCHAEGWEKDSEEGKDELLVDL